jgi:NADH dehydrogenase/NADH:ubiquinone oxidoreductase subunit G
METNKNISKIFEEIIRLLEIKGDKALGYKLRAYKNAINILDNLKVDISDIYKEKGLKGIRELGIGEKNAKKIEEYIKKEKITEFEELNEETAIQNIIAHFFMSKGLGLQELKENAKKRKIIYSRFTKPAKQLLELAGSIEAAKEAIDKVASWANTRKLDYAIETVFKKWLELDRLKPKEIVKKPFYRGDPMIWSETKKKWFVISKYGDWLEYAGKKEEIEWKIIE